ncbi:MAG: rhodanese-like domain-containing protein [Burkholderiales bacterium]|nr:rhodanese-like domain-containing protein [Burkholderiales bacterium]HMM52123.1 rhodanese-like domain-containing protein [Burkholderiaceae bacterium]
MDFITENLVLIAVALVSGAMLLWPMVMRGASGPSLDTLGATRLINDTGAIVLDVRSQADFSGGHLPNARNIPMGELEKRVGELPAGKPVLLCCASGVTSSRAAGILRKAGRSDVFNLGGGLQSWRQAGLPVVK